MANTLILPRITGFKLRGLQPIFTADIDFSIKAGPNIILGGNGLGKTTLVQAVVYGLSGGLDDTVEPDKRFRWNHSYFRSRLRPTIPQLASVEVSFRLLEEQITIRRGFSGTQPIAVRASSIGHDWIEEDGAESVFLDLIQRFGGYGTLADFGFVVNRLLYLPEDRRLLAWDTDAQTRILMLISGDVGAEDEFRRRRAELKKIDSRKRHTRVQIGHAEKHLTKLLEMDEGVVEGEDEPFIATPPDQSLPELVQKLQEASQARLSEEARRTEVENVISGLATQLEKIQEQLEEAEASIVWNLLDTSERERNLAIHKLLENAICPCCGTVEHGLQATARQNQKEHRCYLCGSEQDQATSPDIVRLRALMAENLSLLQSNNHVHIVLEGRVQTARRAELQIQSQVNQIRFDQPLINVKDQDLAGGTKENLLARKAELEHQEALLAIQLKELRADLDRDYQTFLKSMHSRLEMLRRSYEKYATSFLGVTCTLAGVQDGDRLLDLMAFVPEFDGDPRRTPESCSEAQRFFLDIAFRMALIDTATDLSGSSSTFICETPENALDVSYIDNVVGMFKQFAANRNAMLFTANLQHKGIAQKIMASVAANHRAGRVLNLLDYGRLSDVQKKAIKTLRDLARKVIQ